MGRGQTWVRTSQWASTFRGPADSGQVTHVGKIPEERGPTWYLAWAPFEKLLALWASVSPSVPEPIGPVPLPPWNGIKGMK